MRVALAVESGHPVRTTPFPPWPHFDEELIEAVANVLRSGQVNYHTGPHGRLFEQEFAASVDCRHAVAVANGTVALELALGALGIGPGDEVVVPCRSFIASASCCLTGGAKVAFAEVDRVSQNLTAETIRAALTPRTKAIIAVHLFGWPCEMDPILQLAAEHNLYVIEDCAQAHGATYRGQPVGSFGHAAAFSFCQDKILSTGGEGGMLTTNDRSLWERVWSYKDHGKSWEAVNRPHTGNAFRWLHDSIGTNWRMTEMQAALGREVLRKLPEWVATRRRYAAMLTGRLRRLPQLRVPPMPADMAMPADIEHAYYKYNLFLQPSWLKPGWSRDHFTRALQAEGIPCGSGICPEIYLEAAFDGSPMRPAQRFRVAKELGETSLMLQVHPTLRERDILDTCKAIEKVVYHATVKPPSFKKRAA